MSRRSNPPGPPDYQIGYGRPPKKTRFEKGKSGNPGGRPKKKENSPPETTDDVVRAFLMDTFEILDGGKRREVTLLEANLLVLRKKALAGDFKAQRELIRLYERTILPRDTDATGTPIDYTEQVRQKLNDMALRIQQAKAEEEAAQAEARDEKGSMPSRDDRDGEGEPDA